MSRRLLEYFEDPHNPSLQDIHDRIVANVANTTTPTVLAECHRILDEVSPPVRPPPTPSRSEMIDELGLILTTRVSMMANDLAPRVWWTDIAHGLWCRHRYGLGWLVHTRNSHHPIRVSIREHDDIILAALVATFLT